MQCKLCMIKGVDSLSLYSLAGQKVGESLV